MTPTVQAYVAIAAAAAVTYSLRAGGLFLASRLPTSPRIDRFMAALPGALLFSLVVPGILEAGWIGLAGASITALLAYRINNVFLAMAAGMAVVATYRIWF